MQNISFDDAQIKGQSLESFKQHFVDNKYDWSETDIEGYWTKCNPTPAPEPTPKVEVKTGKKPTP